MRCFRSFLRCSSWEELEEDESGRLRALDPTANQRAKRCGTHAHAEELVTRSAELDNTPCSLFLRRRRLLDAAASARIRRGMIRYCVIVIDLSNAVNEARSPRHAPSAHVFGRVVAPADARAPALATLTDRPAPLAPGAAVHARARLHPRLLRGQPAEPAGADGGAQRRRGATHGPLRRARGARGGAGGGAAHGRLGRRRRAGRRQRGARVWR
jgi:hypothetical protein